MNRNPSQEVEGRQVRIPMDSLVLEGYLSIPPWAEAIVLFAHGSGSSRFSPRNRFVAHTLREYGLATLLTDLLTAEEEDIDLRTHHLRFDIELLAHRVIGVADWAVRELDTRSLNTGCFGSGTGTAAALIAVKQRPDVIRAVVSLGGRPDLAASILPEVKAPTLFIVGGHDVSVLGLNQEALAQMRTEKRLEIIPHATHLFEEPDALEKAASLAGDWFVAHLTSSALAVRLKQQRQDHWKTSWTNEL